jgi:hypothetical protein
MRWLIAIARIAAFVGVVFGLYVLLMQIDRKPGEYIDTATGALDYHYAPPDVHPMVPDKRYSHSKRTFSCTRLRDLAVPQINLIA